jgi:type III secretion system OrgA/MxiK family protein
MHSDRAIPASRANTLPARWETVMFDPLAYIHRDRLRLPPCVNTPAQRAAINRMLLDGHGLTAAAAVTAGATIAEPAALRLERTRKLLLKHWFQLAQIVFLLGCQSLRMELSRRGAILRMPASARAFLTFPCRHPPAAAAGATYPMYATHDTRPAAHLDNSALLREGMRQLRMIVGELPEPLAQRMRLLFPPDFDNAAEAEKPAGIPIHQACDPSHALKLTMAIQHARRYPIDI